MLSVYDEGAMTEIRKSMSEVERGIEEALRDFAGQGAASSNGIAVTEITAGERIDRIGNLSTLASSSLATNTSDAGHLDEGLSE